MSDLKDQVKKFVGFSEKELLQSDSITANLLYLQRLSPLLNLLPEVVEALEGYHLESCDRYDNENICRACKTLAKIKEAVGSK